MKGANKWMEIDLYSSGRTRFRAVIADILSNFAALPGDGTNPGGDPKELRLSHSDPRTRGI